MQATPRSIRGSLTATIGYGQLGYDNRRFVADDSITVTGSRKGSYWFGAATVGYEFKYARLRLSPYLRADFMRAELDSLCRAGRQRGAAHLTA